MSAAADILQDLKDEVFDPVPMACMPQIREHEGFRGMPYDDSLGKPTIGVGTLLPLTEDEAMLVAFCRACDAYSELRYAMRSKLGVEISHGFPPDVEKALLEMAFQLGVPRLTGFKKMLAAIRNKEWDKAAAEALDSKWARQTPVRAQHVAEILRKQVDNAP